VAKNVFLFFRIIRGKLNKVKTLAKQFILGKSERLKSRKIIEQLFKEGQRFAVHPFRIFYLPAPMVLQCGVAVSSKNFKKAVDRNRIKRLTREAYRLQKQPLQEKLKGKNSGLYLFLVYTARELPDYQPVYDKMNLILNKLMKLVDEKDTSNT
jgi:ribonuclease P protein component